MNITETIDRYKQAKGEQRLNDKQLQIDMIFASGILLGAKFPGAAAAVEVAFEKLFGEGLFPGVE